jgi:hypothetical protein
MHWNVRSFLLDTENTHSLLDTFVKVNISVGALEV